MAKTTSLVATAALITGAAVVVLTAHSTGATPAYPAQCATPGSPYSGGAHPVVYHTPGVVVRKYTAPGRSPLFTAYGSISRVSTRPLINTAVVWRRQVRDMTGRSLAAVNGDFFTPYGPTSVVVAAGGVPVKGTSAYQHALVTWPDQRVAVSSVKLSIKLNRRTAPHKAVTVLGQTYNAQQVYANGISVFNHYFSATYLLPKLGWAKQATRTFLVRHGRVVGVYAGVKVAAVPSGTLLIVAQGTALSKLARWKVGTVVSVAVAATTPTRHPWAAAGGGTILIQNSAAGATACGYDAATPRTVVGVYPGGRQLILVTATGRGVTMRELMAFMRSLGVAQALMMDGGGSTVMAVRSRTGVHQLTVHPYKNEGDRPVPEGIGFYPR